MKISVLIVTLLLFIDYDWISAEDSDWCRQQPRPGFAKLKKVQANSDWFQVYEIQPGLYAFSESRQYEEVISYLILGSKRALLWDSGMGISRISPVVHKLTALPVVVLNSHTHPDHIGGNHEFVDVWGLATDFTRENEKGYSDPEMKEWVGAGMICGKLPAEFDPAAYAIQPFRISRVVGDGEILDLGDRKLEVIHTPGHTPDALCLLDRKNRILFTGDSFYPGPIYLYSPETNFDDYAQSVKRLVSIRKEIDWLITAHNEPVAPASSLDELHAAVEKIRAGAMRPTDKDGLKEYSFTGFSILMKGTRAR